MVSILRKRNMKRNQSIEDSRSQAGRESFTLYLDYCVPKVCVSTSVSGFHKKEWETTQRKESADFLKHHDFSQI
jgi:hypothetical protein